MRHIIVLVTPLVLATTAGAQERSGSPVPATRLDTAVFAAGCYWGVEAVFEHVRGVRSVVAGFAVPDPAAPGAGRLRHAGYAEAVEIVYDSSQVTYEQLLQVLFQIAHDPTQLDRQGPDVGPQYRSVIFVGGPDEQRTAEAYLSRLRGSQAFAQPVVTEVAWLQRFRPAGEDQQDFVEKNPRSPYVVAHDLPKLEALRRRFPALYRRS